MKKMLNTLYISSPDGYLSLDGENIVVLDGNTEIGRVPLHNFESVVSVGYRGASPALMSACCKHGIDLSFLSPSGRFLARISGEQRGNVVLRKQQYQLSGESHECLKIAKNCIIGKVHNARWVLERAIRDYPMRVDTETLSKKSKFMASSLKSIRTCTDAASLRGIEGETASVYFSAFDNLILQQKDDFRFECRSRRPPLDAVNAMLSFAYSLVVNLCAGALEAVGLDPYVGFLHTDRPGRMSLALDLCEELRSVLAERFVLTLINKKIVAIDGFIIKENGAVLMDDSTRKTFFTQWQIKKSEMLEHPFLDEKVAWGQIPYVQALLLARYIRGDLDEYPPFLWK